MYYIISDDFFFSYGFQAALEQRNEKVWIFSSSDVISGKFPTDVSGSIILVNTECCLTFRSIIWRLHSCRGNIIPIFDISHFTLTDSWKYGYISKKESLVNIISTLVRFSSKIKFSSFTASQELVILAQIHGMEYHNIASSLDKSLTSIYRLRTEAIKASGLWPINTQGIRYIYQILCRNYPHKQYSSRKTMAL